MKNRPLFVLLCVLATSCSYVSTYSLRDNYRGQLGYMKRTRDYVRTLSGVTETVQLENRSWGVFRFWLTIANETKEAVKLPVSEFVIRDETGNRRITSVTVNDVIVKVEDTLVVRPTTSARLFIGADLSDSLRRTWSNSIWIVVPNITSVIGEVIVQADTMAFVRNINH